MPNWRKVIVSGSDAALNSLNVTTAFTASGLNYPTSDGTANQAIVTDGAGNLTFGSPVSTNTTITIKNVSGGTIQKGTPCYITGSGTSGNLAGVWPADAGNANRMPAGVIAGETLTAGSEGIGLINGFISGVDTSAFAAGDSVYVAVGGGYTNIRPTGSAVLVQKLGNVEKSHPSNGSGVINGPGYYNDLPNVQQGYTWVGNGNGVATAIATSSIQNVISSSFASTASHTLAIAGTDNYIPRFNGTSALENSVMYDDGTNIGIGTTIPGYKLDVTGLINATTTPGSYGTIIRVRDTVTSGVDSFGGIHFTSSPGTDYTIGKWTTAAGAGLLQVRDQSGNQFMTINSAGNVGIGATTSLSYRLHVQDSANIGTIAIGNSTYPGLLYSDAGTGEFRIDNRSSAGAGYITFYPNGQAGTLGSEAMRIITNGNVGIGTTSPSQKLEVAGNIFANAGNGEGFLLNGGSAIYRQNGSDLAFNVNSAERMRITSTGNVGIGTTSPSTRLDVRYDDGVSSGEHNVLASFSRSGTGPLVIGYRADGSSVSSALIRIGDSLPLTIGTTSANQAFTLLDNGNIGISNSSPNGALSFADDVRTRKIVLWDGAANNDYQFYGFGVESSTMIQSVYDSTDRFLWVAGTGTTTRNELMVVQGNGNVGIGTTNPAYKLSVIGKIALNSGAGNDIFIGDNAGLSDDATNNANLAIGINASQNNVSGSQNVAIGNNSLQFNVASNNTAVGSNASRYNTLGDNNTSFGSYALWSTIDGRNNTGIGAAALLFNTSGSSNTAVGSSALRNNTSGSGNIGIGLSALNPNTLGNDNIAVGRNAGRYYGSTGTNALTNTSASIFIGDTTRANNLNETNQIVIGVAALGLGSNTVVLGNDNITTTALKGNVGIGTTNPGYKLEVNGTSYFSGLAYFGQTASGGSAFRWGAYGTAVSSNTMLTHNQLYNGSGWTILDSGIGTTYLDLGAAMSNPYISFGTGVANTEATEKMRITNSGNVGIGTTNPDAKLEVIGTIASDYSMADSGNLRILKPRGATYTTTNGGVNGAIKITYPVGFTNTMHRIKLNVYEYTTNESFTIYFGGYNYAPDSSWYNPFAYILNNPAIDRNFTVRFGHDGTNLVVYIGELSNNWTYPQVFIEEVELGYSGANDTWRDGAWSIGFETSAFQNVSQTVSNTQATNLARNGSDAYYNLGNVGIGTTNPYSGTGVRSLNINASSYPVLALSVGGTLVGSLVGYSGYTTLGAKSGNYLVFAPDDTERMRITAAGDVGIGITNPSYKLDVNGTTRSTTFRSDSATSSTGIEISAGTTSGGGSIFRLSKDASNKQVYQTFESDTLYLGVAASQTSLADIGTKSGVSLAFNTSYTERMRITDGGYVGIGTTNPSNKLTVYQDGGVRVTGITNGSYIEISGDLPGYSANSYPVIKSGGSIHFANNGKYAGYLEGSNTYFGILDSGQTTRVFLNTGGSSYFTGGDVGIGTTNPSQKLHVAGNLRVTGAIYDSNNSAGSSGEILTSTGTGTDWVSLSSISGVDGTGTANYVPKWTDADTIGNSAIYDNSGNIGIGTTNPGAKLEVVGTFRATTKSFLIDHPTKEGKKLQYGVLEGPEHSVYVRGKLTGTRRIELPDYWHALIDEDSITVNLTAIGRGQQLWVEEITDTYIMVGSDSGIVNCFYTVFAERKDVDKLITEFDKE